jgi:hypothetical protein
MDTAQSQNQTIPAKNRRSRLMAIPTRPNISLCLPVVSVNHSNIRASLSGCVCLALAGNARFLGRDFMAAVRA